MTSLVWWKFFLVSISVNPFLSQTRAVCPAVMELIYHKPKARKAPHLWRDLNEYKVSNARLWGNRYFCNAPHDGFHTFHSFVQFVFFRARAFYIIIFSPPRIGITRETHKKKKKNLSHLLCRIARCNTRRNSPHVMILIELKTFLTDLLPTSTKYTRRISTSNIKKIYMKPQSS